MNELASSTIEQNPVFAYSTPESQIMATKQFIDPVRSYDGIALDGLIAVCRK